MATQNGVVTATEFLTALFEPASEGYVHIFALDRLDASRKVLWRPITDITGLTLSAKELRDRCCMWFGPALRDHEMGGRRGGSADCTAITAMWVDIDVAGERHALNNLPPTLAAAHELLDAFPIPPSAVIDTGGGLQAWWFLADLIGRATAEPFLVRWGATWADYGRQRQWHVDNVFDIARVMRLPATFNRKATPVEVTVIDWHPQRRYSIDDLDQWTIEPPQPVKSLSASRAVPYIGPERPGDAFNAVVDPAALLERIGFVFDHDVAATGERHYRAPHHAGERGNTGATVYPDGHTTIWSETFCSTRTLMPKRPYDAFGLFAHLEHGGDWREASNTLARRGYGTKAMPFDPFVTEPAQATAIDVTDDDWSSIDLTPIARAMRNGDHHPTMPEILHVEGAMPLLYRQRVNSLFGESGGGKTWVALAAIAEVVRGGGRALLIDYEDNSNGIAERLMLMGLDDDEIALVDYRNPSTGILLGVGQLEIAGLAEYDLIIIDSTGEAMAAGGVDSNADREVAQWFAIVKRLCRLPGGPAVVVLDHVPKDVNAPSSYAIGSQRKRAAVTGAAYRVDTLKEPAKGKDGKLKLTVAKDRLGNRPKGLTAAVVEVRSTMATVAIELHITDAQIATERGEVFRPTVYMERVSRWLEDNPGEARRALLLAVQGKRGVVELAVDTLTDEGWITVVDGPRRARLYTSVRPFRDDDDPTCAPRPDRGPTAALSGPRPHNRPRPSPPSPTGEAAVEGRGENTNDETTAALEKGRGQTAIDDMEDF